MLQTVGGRDLPASTVCPAEDRNEVGHETRDAALQNDVIAANNVLLIDVRFIWLRSHCKDEGGKMIA